MAEDCIVLLDLAGHDGWFETLSPCPRAPCIHFYRVTAYQMLHASYEMSSSSNHMLNTSKCSSVFLCHRSHTPQLPCQASDHVALTCNSAACSGTLLRCGDLLTVGTARSANKWNVISVMAAVGRGQLDQSFEEENEVTSFRNRAASGQTWTRELDDI